MCSRSVSIEKPVCAFPAPGPTIVTSPRASVRIVSALVAPITAASGCESSTKRGATEACTFPPSRHTLPISL